MTLMLELLYEDGGVSQRATVRHGLTMGRSSDNDVVLRDFSVSRYHAKIEADGAAFRVLDLDSTNGVKVNDTFVTAGVISAGDRLTIGSFQLQVEAAGEAPAESGLSSATYLRPLSEFNLDYGLDGHGASMSVSKEVGARERVFEILAQVAKTLIQVEELEPVLEKVMDMVFDHVMVDRGFIVLFDQTGTPKLELFRARQADGGAPPAVPISRTILDMVTRQQVAVMTHDAQADQRFEAGRSIRIHQIRSAMCAPLWHRDLVIGVIYVDSPLHVGSFSTSDLDLLTALANYAAVAIERARLNERIQRERLARDRLMRYHSPAVIDAVLSAPDHGPSVTLRETSILFADIVGFTPRTESMAPEEVARFLNQFFSLAGEAIFDYGGTLDKFIGDEVMAFFGAPLPQDDHAERAVRTALKLMDAIDGWNVERAAQGLDQIAVRVAINSGPVVVGDIGSARRVDYTVLGNTVNVAARLESFVSRPGWIVIGETTFAAVSDLFRTEHLGEVQMKGLSRKIATYRILRDSDPGPA